MDCESLAATGPQFVQLVLALVLAGGCVLAGIILLARARRRGRTAVALLALFLACGFVIGTSHAVPAQAATTSCTTPNTGGQNSLTITQTSTMAGLAPTEDPAPITGTVRNNGTDSTFITAIVVSIVSVTKAPGAASGDCDASDYRLLDTRMPVGQTLAPGGSTGFAGASIGFNDKSVNQDACQGATIHLLYSTSS